MKRVRTYRCDRARAAVSLALDDELSQLERAFLEAHILRCPACAAYRAESSAITRALRAAPLEEMARPVRVAARSRAGRRRVLTVAAAAASFAAIAAGGLFGVTHAGTHGRGGSGARPAYLESIDYEQALMREYGHQTRGSGRSDTAL